MNRNVNVAPPPGDGSSAGCDHRQRHHHHRHGKRAAEQLRHVARVHPHLVQLAGDLRPLRRHGVHLPGPHADPSGRRRAAARRSSSKRRSSGAFRQTRSTGCARERSSSSSESCSSPALGLKPASSAPVRTGTPGRAQRGRVEARGLADSLCLAEVAEHVHAGRAHGLDARTLAPRSLRCRPMAEHAQRAHHRHHRPGRQLPGRVPAGEGLRGARHGPPLLDRDLPAPPGLPRRPRPSTPATCSTSARWST